MAPGTQHQQLDEECQHPQQHQEPDAVWRPSDPESTAMFKYRNHVIRKFRKAFRNTGELQRWSIDQSHDFWIDVYGYLDLMPSLDKQTRKAYDDESPMHSIPQFFPQLRLNTPRTCFAGQSTTSEYCADRSERGPADGSRRRAHYHLGRVPGTGSVDCQCA